VTSILMIGQYYLERRFSRGVGEQRPMPAANPGAITEAVQTMKADNEGASHG
jgi:hypothetical protein